MKSQAEEEIATLWLSTAEMGFSLTEEPNAGVVLVVFKDPCTDCRRIKPASIKTQSFVDLHDASCEYRWFVT